ncbi:MAG: hypothetical protein HQL80_09465 [Magnetococcales bacterium]|nr:hypothetical protein [Magnetococcales bacterium]
MRSMMSECQEATSGQNDDQTSSNATSKMVKHFSQEKVQLVAWLGKETSMVKPLLSCWSRRQRKYLLFSWLVPCETGLPWGMAVRAKDAPCHFFVCSNNQQALTTTVHTPFSLHALLEVAKGSVSVLAWGVQIGQNHVSEKWTRKHTEIVLFNNML